MQVLGSLGIVGMLLLIFMAILWIFLPFAVFGFKDLIRSAIEQQKNTNKLLQQLIESNELKAKSAKVDENTPAVL